MSRSLVFGDLHLTEKAEWSKVGSTGLPEILEYGGQTLSWLDELAEEMKVDRVVFLGDLFAQGARISGLCLQVATEGFENLAYKREAVALVGNHDLITKDGRFNSLSFLRLCGFRVYWAAMHNQEFGCIPYPVTDPKEMLAAFYESKGPPVLFAHQAVTGGLLRPGMRDKRDTDETDLLAGPKLVLLGHYHHPEDRAKGRLTYVGSPMYHHWGDHIVDLPRGAVVVHHDKKPTVERFANPYTPRFYTFELNKEKPTRKEASQALSRVRLPSRSFVRLRYTPSRAEDAEKLKKRFSSKLAGFKMEQLSQWEEIDVEEPVIVNGRQPKPPEKVIKTWVRDHPPAGSKKEVFELGSKILSTVKDNAG